MVSLGQFFLVNCIVFKNDIYDTNWKQQGFRIHYYEQIYFEFGMAATWFLLLLVAGKILEFISKECQLMQAKSLVTNGNPNGLCVVESDPVKT